VSGGCPGHLPGELLSGLRRTKQIRLEATGASSLIRADYMVWCRYGAAAVAHPVISISLGLTCSDFASWIFKTPFLISAVILPGSTASDRVKLLW
jgi:hypothetical protein